MLRPDFAILDSIKLFSVLPTRRFYTRCWGCGKRRLFGEWWEGYQRSRPLFEQTNDEPPHWGWFCSSCIVIIVNKIAHRVEEEKTHGT